MKVRVSPSKIRGSIAANSSKSAMQRAIAAALLAEGRSVLENPCLSHDCIAALKVAENLGASVSYFGDKVEIIGHGVAPNQAVVNCGESGLGIRMFTPIVALCGRTMTIQGEGSLKTRPIHFFEDVLPQLDVKCQTKKGRPPLKVRGPLNPKDITIDGSLSSQFLTGLLMAYGAVAEYKTIRVDNLTSKPYVELTLEVMKYFGVQVENKNLEEFYFGEKQSYVSRDYRVEGDWSGAAFLLVAGAISEGIEVKNLDVNSTQSDKAVLKAIKKTGALVTINEHSIQIQPAALKAFEFDATQCPDLFPPLVALAAYCKGITKIKGAERLTHKESNRSVALEKEFGKMGIEINVEGDDMYITGGMPIRSAKVYSHNDHRIAMACATAAANAEGPIEIVDAEAVNKSYPEFWEHWSKIGGKVEEL